MKKFINGKRYDTDSATAVYEVKTRDTQEVLYRKKTGDFFTWDYNRRIKPLSREEAAEWAKKANINEDTYNRLFGNSADEIEKNVAFYLLLPESLHAALKEEAAKNFESMKDLTVKILRQYLQK